MEVGSQGLYQQSKVYKLVLAQFKGFKILDFKIDVKNDQNPYVNKNVCYYAKCFGHF